MSETRKEQLEKNFSRMFWLQGLLNIKVINVVSTLFFLHRGITLGQIFYISIIWGAVSFLFEIPSSYLADKWGRKKTILLGVSLALAHWILLFFAYDFVAFSISFIFASLSYACFTGTDDALIYDTNRELGNEGKSLQRFTKYYSARNFFKIFAPLIGAIVAKDLMEWQFVLVLIIDLFAVSSAFFFALRLIEPHHYIDVEKQEAGVFIDAWKLIRSDWQLVRAILSRTLIFIAMFIIWRFHQEFFIQIGIPVIILGIIWSIYHIGIFVFNQYLAKAFYTKSVEKYINMFNTTLTLFLLLFIILLFVYPQRYILLVLLFAFLFVEQLRWPVYSEYYNKRIFSFNRATTLSLSNFIKGLLDIPIIFIAALLVGINMNYVFILSLILCILVVLFFRLSKIVYEPKAS